MLGDAGVEVGEPVEFGPVVLLVFGVLALFGAGFAQRAVDVGELFGGVVEAPFGSETLVEALASVADPDADGVEVGALAGGSLGELERVLE